MKDQMSSKSMRTVPEYRSHTGPPGFAEKPVYSSAAGTGNRCYLREGEYQYHGDGHGVDPYLHECLCPVGK